MQRKRKDDTDRFMQAIAAFTAAPEEITPRGRRLQCGTGSAVSAMLAEIDETVLRRRLVFETDGGANLILDVGERRLLSVVEAPSASEICPPGLIGRTLEEMDAGVVLRLLTDYAEPSSEVFVSSRLSEAGETDVFQGLSAKTLLEQQDAPALEGLSGPLLQAVKMSQAHCHALVVQQSGQSVLCHGEQSLHEKLEAQLNTLETARPARREVTLWCADPPELDAVLLVEADEVRVALVGSFESLQTDFPVWQKAVVQ